MRLCECGCANVSVVRECGNCASVVVRVWFSECGCGCASVVVVIIIIIQYI